MAGLLTADALPGAVPADAVEAELRIWASEPLIWGVSDCGRSVVSYVERLTGHLLDPPLANYTTELGAARYLRRSGGFTNLFRTTMARLGCTEVTEAARGDIGLLDLEPGGETACLCLGRYWAARCDTGFGAFIGHREITVWRPPCPSY